MSALLHPGFRGSGSLLYSRKSDVDRCQSFRSSVERIIPGEFNVALKSEFALPCYTISPRFPNEVGWQHSVVPRLQQWASRPLRRLRDRSEYRQVLEGEATLGIKDRSGNAHCSAVFLMGNITRGRLPSQVRAPVFRGELQSVEAEHTGQRNEPQTWST